MGFIRKSLGLFIFFFFFLGIMLIPSASSEKVSVTLYYETLCPYCADFIVNHLVKIFQNGLISAVNLRWVPWGNAWLNPDGSFACQHGSDECLLNTIEACTISIYPDVNRHFTFIHCVERFTLGGKHGAWANCFEMTGLGTEPIDCYNSGNGYVLNVFAVLSAEVCYVGNAWSPYRQDEVTFDPASVNKWSGIPLNIEGRYARETAQLKPPHRFVPWVIVNGKPLQEDYQNFMAYICKAYKGTPPQACRSIRYKTESTEQEKPVSQVCFANQGRNSTH